VGVALRGEDGPEVGHAVHVAGDCGDAGTVGSQAGIVCGGQDVDFNLGKEVAKAFGEVWGRACGWAVADNAGQGLDVGRVAGADLHARELGLASEVGGDGCLHDVADGFGAH